jgi:DNA-directed RNA polymerase subunit RPC12/RpoP
MKEHSAEQEEVYTIECSWCGAKIREDKQDDATGVCLQCFYRFLSNHLMSQKRSVYGEFVSDR